VTNDLVINPGDLDHLPGAPFSDEETDGAVADVRGAAGWHIAPVKTETVTLDVSWGEPRLRLPTRKLLAVTAIRDTDTASVISSTTYRVSLALAQVKRRSSCWPSGFGRIAVDMQHGYTACPPDLLAVIAEAANLARRGQSLRSVQIDDFQQAFGDTPVVGGLIGVTETLNRYSLVGQPLYGLGIA
jgi:hypothetical protein